MQRRPVYMTPVLITLNILWFLWNIYRFRGAMVTGDLTTGDMLASGAVNTLSPTLLALSIFSHANALHLAGNMIFIHTAGRAVESRYGAFPVAVTYLATGMLGAYLSVSQGHTTIGASGSAYGLFGVFTALCITDRHMRPYLKDTFMMFIVMTILAQNVPNIDHTAHITGYITGILLGMTFALTERVTRTDSKE